MFFKKIISVSKTFSKKVVKTKKLREKNKRKNQFQNSVLELEKEIERYRTKRTRSKN